MERSYLSGGRGVLRVENLSVRVWPSGWRPGRLSLGKEESWKGITNTDYVSACG